MFGISLSRTIRLRLCFLAFNLAGRQLPASDTFYSSICIVSSLLVGFCYLIPIWVARLVGNPLLQLFPHHYILTLDNDLKMIPLGRLTVMWELLFDPQTP